MLYFEGDCRNLWNCSQFLRTPSTSIPEPAVALSTVVYFQVSTPFFCQVQSRQGEAVKLRRNTRFQRRIAAILMYIRKGGIHAMCFEKVSFDSLVPGAD